MIHGSLWAELMEYDGHIHGYGTPIFGNIVVYVSKLINNKKQRFGLPVGSKMIFSNP